MEGSTLCMSSLHDWLCRCVCVFVSCSCCSPYAPSPCCCSLYEDFDINTSANELKVWIYKILCDKVARGNINLQFHFFVWFTSTIWWRLISHFLRFSIKLYVSLFAMFCSFIQGCIMYFVQVSNLLFNPL